MRTIITGIIVFILWSALCTWFYLAYIKGPAPDETVQTDQSVVEMTPASADTTSTVIEQETIIESPGSYTVYHEFDRSEIITDLEFDNFIDQVITYREQTPGSKLNVTGHTDNVGSDSYNHNLGLRRAQSTMDYLERNGIPGQIIIIASEGESAPVTTNETDAGRAKNRRTEIHVTD